jgi:UDP:flavonoid glycosyltransferase YjiC (YdhE family)
VPAPAGVEVRGYVPGLYRLLAACDVAVVQGGLTTTMELTAARRPFLYFPLRHHFEQQRHVAHRLDRHGAGTRMDYDTATPESIGEALAAELARPVAYRPVPTDGARKAAALLADLL